MQFRTLPRDNGSDITNWSQNKQVTQTGQHNVTGPSQPSNTHTPLEIVHALTGKQETAVHAGMSGLQYNAKS